MTKVGRKNTRAAGARTKNAERPTLSKPDSKTLTITGVSDERRAVALATHLLLRAENILDRLGEGVVINGSTAAKLADDLFCHVTSGLLNCSAYGPAAILLEHAHFPAAEFGEFEGDEAEGGGK